MKKTIAVAGLMLFFSTAARADHISNNISANLNHTALDAFAKDVGSLVGGGSFHQGRSLGFPLGVDVGGHGVAVDLQDHDTILRDDGSRAESGFVQAEVGLPAKLNLILRGGQFENAKVYGGGLRVGVFTPPIASLIPSVSVSALYDKLNHDYVDADVWSANAVVSVDVPFIHPYLGVGWDWTKLTPTDRAFDAAPSGTARIDSKVHGYRGEVGVNLSVIPFTYINLAVGSTNSKAMYHAGLGLRF